MEAHETRNLPFEQLNETRRYRNDVSDLVLSREYYINDIRKRPNTFP